MQISDVRLTTADPDGAVHFYRDVLELAVTTRAGLAEVRLGRSTVTLVPGPTGPGVHHLAFDVPANRFADAKAWLSRRLELLTSDGADEFEGPGSWDSRSLYFTGPDRIVLELIARHRLDNAASRPFSSADLLDVSEVGLAVADVGQSVAELCRTFGVAPFGSGSDTFAPVGNHEGLLILASPGRVWFPTEAQACQGGAVSVTLAAGPDAVTDSWSTPDGSCSVTRAQAY